MYRKAARIGQKKNGFFHTFNIILHSLNTCQWVKLNGRTVVVRFGEQRHNSHKAVCFAGRNGLAVTVHNSFSTYL